MKVLLWEGGIRGVGFVRGGKRLCQIPPGGHTTALMHSSDWLPTICFIAGCDTFCTLPLDGYNQWPTLSRGLPTPRTTIFHNVPVGAAPVPFINPKTNQIEYSTSSCLSYVDNRTGPCHGFGLTGGAIRKNEWKLLTTYPGAHPWEDSSPEGIAQYTPGGTYPNGSRVFVPVTNDSIPAMHRINDTLVVFLFNLTADPTGTKDADASAALAVTMLVCFV